MATNVSRVENVVKSGLVDLSKIWGRDQ